MKSFLLSKAVVLNVAEPEQRVEEHTTMLTRPLGFKGRYLGKKIMLCVMLIS